MRPLSKQAIKRRIKSGRGSGEGKDYRPWLTVSDVPSKGISSRVPAQGIDRVHHVLSRVERMALVLAQWRDDVVDIREQFPLLPQEETIQIADKIAVRHPTYPKTQDPVVMTTDFLLTLRNKYQLAVAVKTIKDLKSRRTREKLLIEKLYWSSRGVSWKLALDVNLPAIAARNLEWFFECWEQPIEPPLLQQVEEALFATLVAAEGVPFTEVCRQVDDIWCLEPGTAVRIARHALAHKRWSAPLYERLDDVHRPFDVRRLIKTPRRNCP